MAEDATCRIFKLPQNCVDIKIAFASVQRGSVVTADDGSEEWLRHPVSCGLSPEAGNRVVNNTCRATPMVLDGLEDHAAQLLNELHANTWFSVEAVNGFAKLLEERLQAILLRT